MIFQNQNISDEKLDSVSGKQPLLLVSYHGEQAIGFKLGYIISETDTFFSWLGGVHPEYRRQGIAQRLLDKQEDFAVQAGMEIIYFTTYDRFPAMIKLGQKNRYKLVKSELDDGEVKYWYEKALPKL